MPNFEDFDTRAPHFQGGDQCDDCLGMDCANCPWASEEDYEDLELGFNPYEGCYDFDC